MKFYEIKTDVFIDINGVSIIRIERSEGKFRCVFTLKNDAKINSKVFTTVEEARKMVEAINEVSNEKK